MCVPERRQVAVQLRPGGTPTQTERLLEGRGRGAVRTGLGRLARSSHELFEFVDVKLAGPIRSRYPHPGARSDRGRELASRYTYSSRDSRALSGSPFPQADSIS